jgi:hypothetical protein
MHADGGGGVMPEERAAATVTAVDAAAGSGFVLLVLAAGQFLMTLDSSVRLEMLGDLHEYGGLGRVVTKSEALAAI